MPVIGLGLHFIVAILFAVHAVRRGQERYWLFVLFMFPVLGSIIYALAIWLPSLRHDRTARALTRGIRKHLDPGRELREAQDAFDHSATVDHRLRLADALAAAGRHDDAVREYRAALSGPHSDNPDFQVRLAAALLDSGDATQASALLDDLILRHPHYKSPAGHLLYARALAASGEHVRARGEFDALIGYYAGFEARARYAQALADWGEVDAARDLGQQSLLQVRRLPKYAQRANREWINRLQRHAESAHTGG